MPPTGPAEDSRSSAQGREAQTAASRPTPLTLVADAVAGEDLASVATTVARALSCPVAIAIPALGEPVVSPPGSLDAATSAAITARAATVAGSGAANGNGDEPRDAPSPSCIGEAVEVRIADQVVGIVAAVATQPAASRPAAERRAWLEAAAAAASVTALLREAHVGAAGGADGTELLAELSAGEPGDVGALLARARRLGAELDFGAVAICARRPPGAEGRPLNGELHHGTGALIAARGPGRLLALVPLTAEGDPEPAHALARRLRDDGWSASVSAARRDPAQLHQSVLEAELLTELGRDDDDAGRDDTYRLLIGVLLRDRDELCQLREHTVSPLAEYDARHDTELLATLQAFLTHDGSTTETAEAMALHRHTVGYRLSRVHEVSGLSPYASDGRERLGLGIKAQRILEADRRRGAQH